MTGLEIGIQMSSAGLPVAALDNFTPWAPAWAGYPLCGFKQLLTAKIAKDCREGREGSTSAFRVLEQGGRILRLCGEARCGWRAGRICKKKQWMDEEPRATAVLIL